MAVPRLIRQNQELLNQLIQFLKELKGDSRTALSEEDLVMEYIASSENYFFLDLVFIEYDAKLQTMKIKSHVEEVLPSRFRRLFVSAREAVNKNRTFKDYLTYKETAGSAKKKEEIYSFRFKYGYLLQFFDSEDYLPIENTFYGIPFDSETLYKNFMRYYRTNFSLKLQGEMYHSLRKTVIEALGVITYLYELELLKLKFINYEVNMEKDTEQIRKEGSFDLERLEEFIKINPAFFDQKYKVGLFSLGILIRLVMNIQNVNLGSTPFEKKMKGYHISGNDLEHLYVEALAKLEQYQGHYAYNNLRKFMTEYFNLEMPFMKKLSSSEISFYIVSGIELQFAFKSNFEIGE